MAIYDAGTASLTADGTVNGVGTTWRQPLTLIRVGATMIFNTTPASIVTIAEIISDTEIRVFNDKGFTAPAGTQYSILAHDGITVQGLAQDVAETLRYYQSRETEVAAAVDAFNQFDAADFEQKVTNVNNQSQQVSIDALQVSVDKADVQSSLYQAEAARDAAQLSSSIAASSAQDAESSAQSVAGALIGTFQDGVTIQSKSQQVLDIKDGVANSYVWAGSLPKTVPADSSPESTGGISDSAWIRLASPKSKIFYSNFENLQQLGSYINSNNLKNVEIVFDKTVEFAEQSGGYGTILTFSDMDNLTIKGMVIDDKALYSGAFDLTRVFDLNNIKNVSVIDVVARSTLEYVGDDKRGLTVLRLYNCDNFKFTGYTSRCYQGYEIHNVKNVQVNTVNDDTRYPHSLTSIGTIDLYTKNNGCRRDFFLQDNCSGGQITVDAIDTQQGTPIKIYFYDDNMDNEISNLTVNYKFRSTGRYDSIIPSRTPPIWLEWGWDSTTTQQIIRSRMSNIVINYDVIGGTWGSVVGTRKLIDESVGDVTGRGYEYSNITVKGRIDIGSTAGKFNGFIKNNFNVF